MDSNLFTVGFPGIWVLIGASATGSYQQNIQAEALEHMDNTTIGLQKSIEIVIGNPLSCQRIWVSIYIFDVGRCILVLKRGSGIQFNYFLARQVRDWYARKVVIGINSIGCDVLSKNANHRGWKRGLLPLLLLLALSLKLIHLADMRAAPIHDFPVMDAGYHHQWALSIVRGEPITDGLPYFRAPLYPWLLAILYKLGGNNLIIPRLFQAFLGVFSLAILYRIGLLLFSRAVALLAVLLGILYPLLTYYDGELLLTSLALFLDLSLILLLLEACRRRRAIWWAAAGIVLGLAALARPNILIFAPAIPIWLSIARRGRFVRTVALPTLMVALSSLLVILPVTIRNAREGGERVFIAWQGGLNFYLGNHTGADGWSATAPGIRKDWWGGYEDGIRIPSRDLGRQLTFNEISNYWFRRGGAFLKENPGEGAKLLARKAYLLLYGAELSNNQILSFSGRYSRVFRNLPLSFGVLAPLALVGLFLLGRHRTRSLLIFYFFTYGSTLVLFFVCSRFRIPLLPFFLLFAAGALVEIAKRVRRSPPTGAALLAAVLVLMVLLNHDFGVIPPVNLAWGYEGEGVSLLAQGRYDEAAGRFRSAIDHNPRSSQAHHDLGIALREGGNPEEAIPSFRRALEIDRFNAEAYNNLALSLARTGRDDEAITTYRKGIEIDSRHPGLHINLAMLLHNKGLYEEAIEEYGAFIRTGIVDGRVHTNLGICLEQLGRLDEAERELRRGVTLAPDQGVPALRLAGFLAVRGDVGEARRILEEAAERMPGNGDIAEALELLRKESDDE